MSWIDSDNFAGNTAAFDETICREATFADLDMEQVAAFLQGDLVRRDKDYYAGYDEQQQMETFGLAQGKHPSYGALLCFGIKPSRWSAIAGAYTRCNYTSSSGQLEDKECQGGLLQQLVEAREFLQKHLNFGRVIERGGSSEQPEFPFSVLEEALANALIHREYVTEPEHTPRAEGVTVEISRDHVKISNPSGTPQKRGVGLRRIGERHLGSRPRNPQIMRIFKLAGHAERAGTGIARIQQSMQEAGLQQPDIELDPHTQTFSITLHRPVLTEYEADRQTGYGAIVGGVTQDIALGGPSRPYHLVRTILFIALSIALICGVLGLGAFAAAPQWYISTFVPASTTIEIASEFPTSGVDTTLGLPEQYGVQMAIDDANQNHVLPGYTFKPSPYNDVGINNRHDPLKGASNLKQAIADNLVAGIVGPENSAVAVAELPIANQADIALISPSNTYPCLTKDVSADSDCHGSYDIEAQMKLTGHLTYFRLSTTNDREGKAAADFFFQTKHYHKVLLLKDDSDVYSSGLAQAFQEAWTQLGGQVVPLELSENASSVQNYQKTLQAVAALQPDLIYFAGNDPNGSDVLQALSNMPQLKSVTFAGGDGIMDSGFLQTVVRLHPSALVYITLSIQDPEHSRQAMGMDFKPNYIAKGYAYYRPSAAAAYDCTMMLIQAIKKALQQRGVSTPHGTQDQVGAKHFRQAILQALAQLRYTGATGTQSFDGNGDTSNHTISFYQVNIANSQAEWQWLKQVSG